MFNVYAMAAASMLAACLFTGSGLAQTPAKDGAEFLVNTTTTNIQSSPSVAALTGGGFVVAWSDESALVSDTSQNAVRAQLYDAAGAATGGEFLVNTTTNLAQYEPSVAAFGGGGFVIVWTDYSALVGDTSGTALRAQRFDAAGTPVGVEFLVNTTTFSSQYTPSVAALTNGGFVIAWGDGSESGGDTTGSAIRAQRYDAAGVAAGGEFVVNTTTTSFQLAPSIVALTSGGFVIAWQDQSATGGDTDSWAIRAQRYDAVGVPVGGEFLVNTLTPGAQEQPSVAALPGGGFVIAWLDGSQAGGDTSGTAIHAQRYYATGAAAGAEFLVNTTTNGIQEHPSVAALSGGGFVIGWSDYSAAAPDTFGTAVRAQRFNAVGTPVGGGVRRQYHNGQLTIPAERYWPVRRRGAGHRMDGL